MSADGRFGQEESGIDGGGLFKEFLTSLSKEAFDTNRGLWLVTDENQLYPNPHSYAKEGELPYSSAGGSS
jgi:ubiquitin-protein ligase E3 C